MLEDRIPEKARVAFLLVVAGLALASRRVSGAAPSAGAPRAFADLLRVTRLGAAPSSHWRVTLPSWREAEAAWKDAAAAMPDSRLTACAVPLLEARRLVERAQRTFQEAAGGSHPNASALQQEHDALHRHAEGPLKRAELCYQVLTGGSGALPTPQRDSKGRG